MAETNQWRWPTALEQWLAPLLRASKRRTVLLLACLIGGGAFLLWAARPLPPRTAPSPAPSLTEKADNGPELGSGRLAAELSTILARIAGAGRVDVRLTLAASGANQWEENRRRNYRTVEDRAEDGGVQVTTEETEETTLALTRRTDGSEAPVERSVTAPQIAGAIVVADGANDPRIKAELARAAAAFLGIGLHRVMVFPRTAVEQR